MNKSSHNGILGENYAARLLEKKGYSIEKRNYHSRYGEIDIIAKNDEYIVFAEVKTRSKGSIAQPREWVDSIKQEKIIKTAAAFLQELLIDLQPRFDVIEVFIDEKIKIAHIENAFESNI